MDLRQVEVVLVRPARAANVAAACRALKNMGLHRLTLADCALAVDQPADRALAYGAWDLLDGARRTATLAEAVSQCTYVAATSGRGGTESLTPRELARDAGRLAGAGPLAVVFGPEASGLRDDELRLCHAVVRIPSDPGHPSLNLAQAVLLLAYELRQSASGEGAPAAPRASAGELAAAFEELREALLAIGYLNPQAPDHVLAELRALVARAGPSPREVALLRGLARQVRWAGSRVAPGPDPG